MKAMIEIFIFLFVITISSKNIFAQNQNSNLPDEHINVNREFDKNGNLTKYDSTYSWSWSSNNNNDFDDSIYSKFPEFVTFRNFFDNSFINQSDLFNDSAFFNNNNFDKQMQDMLKYQQQLFDEMFKQLPDNSSENKKDKIVVPQQNKSQNKGIDL